MTAPTPPPRLHGYFRVTADMDEAAVLRVRSALRDFAVQHGCELVDTYEDSCPGDRLTLWLELARSCRREQSPALVVVSLDNLHPSPRLADQVREDLAQTINGKVLVAGSDSGAAAHDS